MLKIVLFLILFVCGKVCSSQSSDLIEADYFDPLLNPIAQKINQRVRLLVSEDVLVRSVSENFPRVGEIEKVDRQFIEGFWWLTIESRHARDIEQSVFLAIRLKSDENDYYYADSFWTACTGEGCGGCDFKLQMDGCFCRFYRPGEPGIPGACYQTTSDEMLMQKVSIKPKRE